MNLPKDQLTNYNKQSVLEISILFHNREVPYADAIDNTSNEHRKWRTPIEILLPMMGTDDDNSVSTPDISNGLQTTIGDNKVFLDTYEPMLQCCRIDDSI